jgi:glycosyltransferase involved in cell wall biosynthesis
MTESSGLPLVVIATPVYNGARYLAETMSCVQAQTYPNVVHCLLDNASADETPDIIKRFKGQRVPVITARNPETVPMMDNWNAALRLAPKGTAFFRSLPANDLIRPDCIEKMVAIAERYPHINVIGCQEMYRGKVYGDDLPAGQEVFKGREIVRGWLRKAIQGFPVLHCLYRTPAGGVPDPFYFGEIYDTKVTWFDMDAAMRVLCSGDGAFVHEPLVETRYHADSATEALVRPSGMNLWTQLQVIDRWGPSAFESTEDFQRCRREHLRYYWRHYLMWQAKRQEALVEKHRDLLGRANALPTFADYIAAAAEWPGLKAGRRFEQVWAQLGRRPRQYQLSS